MKKVFSTIADCIHTFAQFSQPEGRSGNVFFEGDTLYSYSRHFPIAIRVTNSKCETAILMNGRSYSTSTSDHQRQTWSATRHYTQITSFGLYHWSRYSESQEAAHRENEKWYIQIFIELAGKLATARKPEKYIQQAQQHNATAEEYFSFFGIEPSTEYRERYADTQKVSQVIREQIRKRQAEERERRKERETEARKSMETKIQEWINGERSDCPRLDYDILRKRTTNTGDIIVETSQNVRMSQEEAKQIYFALIRQELKPGAQVLDRYTVISVNGTVTIGCHTFETDFLLNFGKTL